MKIYEGFISESKKLARSGNLTHAHNTPILEAGSH